jgi:hypothetical protein
MMKQQGIGTYLAQGWAANALLAYLLLVWIALFSASPGDSWVFLIAMPIYASIVGTLGGAVGLFVWLFESLRGRKTTILFRGMTAILLPLGLPAIIVAVSGSWPDLIVVLWVTTPIVVLVLPPALLSGSPLNPLKIIVMDLAESLPKYGWARALSLIAVPLLRIAGLLAVLEALLFLSCQRPDLSGWNQMEKEFAGAVIAVVYFAITLTVSLCLPKKPLVLAIGILANAPVAALAAAAHQRGGTAYLLLAVGGWVFVSLWTLFVLRQLLRSETRRVMPVTFLEVRIRQALNYW